MTRKAQTKKNTTRQETLHHAIEEAARRINILPEWANLAPPPPVTTQRQPIYGHPALNFARQAIMWSGLLANKLVKPITPQEVALMMAACKIARLVETPTHEDSITDVGGYMSCLEQVNACVDAGTDGTGIRSETVAQQRATTGNGPT